MFCVDHVDGIYIVDTVDGVDGFAENNYLVMLGHMSKQTQLWSDAQIIWSDVTFS